MIKGHENIPGGNAPKTALKKKPASWGHVDAVACVRYNKPPNTEKMCGPISSSKQQLF